MARKRVSVCSVPGCPNMTPEALCKAHRAVYEQERGSRQARGYGPAHDALRRAWRQRIDRFGASCARCGQPIPPFTEFDLDHSDDRTYYLGPSHPLCNRGKRGDSAIKVCVECGNDEPCQGYTVCSDCLETVYATSAETVSATESNNDLPTERW